jgi:ribonuclease HI
MDTNKIPLHISIADNKESSKIEAQNANKMVQIFTDGSALNKKVGAAAILIRPGQRNRILHYHLGSTKEHDNYEAELVAILMGLHLINTEKSGNVSFALGVDNHAAIKALTSNLTHSGQNVALMTIKLASTIRN